MALLDRFRTIFNRPSLVEKAKETGGPVLNDTMTAYLDAQKRATCKKRFPKPHPNALKVDPKFPFQFNKHSFTFTMLHTPIPSVVLEVEMGIASKSRSSSKMPPIFFNTSLKTVYPIDSDYIFGRFSRSEKKWASRRFVAIMGSDIQGKGVVCLDYGEDKKLRAWFFKLSMAKKGNKFIFKEIDFDKMSRFSFDLAPIERYNGICFQRRRGQYPPNSATEQALREGDMPEVIKGQPWPFSKYGSYYPKYTIESKPVPPRIKLPPELHRHLIAQNLSVSLGGEKFEVQVISMEAHRFNSRDYPFTY